VTQTSLTQCHCEISVGRYLQRRTNQKSLSTKFVHCHNHHGNRSKVTGLSHFNLSPLQPSKSHCDSNQPDSMSLWDFWG
jgi:hypothetical protein